MRLTDELKKFLKYRTPKQLRNDWDDLQRYNKGINVNIFIERHKEEAIEKEETTNK